MRSTQSWNGRGGGFALGKCWRKQRSCVVTALALQGRSSAPSIIDAHQSSEAQPLQSNGHTINLLGGILRFRNAKPPPLPFQAGAGRAAARVGALALRPARSPHLGRAAARVGALALRPPSFSSLGGRPAAR